MIFFEFLNFETEKFEILPENSFRIVPEKEFFSEIRIFRSEIFSLSATTERERDGETPHCSSMRALHVGYLQISTGSGRAPVG